MAGNDYSDMIEKTLRLLTPTQNEQQLQITTNYVAGSGTLVVDDTSPAYAMAGRPGSILSSGPGGPLQLWIVQQDHGSGNLSVIGGFQGSTDTNVTASTTAPSATVIVRPKFSRYDISVAINDELAGLSSPGVGLGQIETVDVTYVPAFMGYDLGATFDAEQSRVLEVNYAEPLPWKRNPRVRSDMYRVIRNQSASYFPNGNGIILYEDAWPGLPVRVTYIAPFAPLVNLTDNVLSVAGVPVRMQDLVAWGAALRLAPDREIQRNTMATQPDPRKAQEVPPGAIRGSVDGLTGLANRYWRRINQEQATLRHAYPHSEQ